MGRSLSAKTGAESAPRGDAFSWGIARRFRTRAEGSPWGVIMAFLAPALALYLLLTAWPILKTFYNSVH